MKFSPAVTAPTTTSSASAITRPMLRPAVEENIRASAGRSSPGGAAAAVPGASGVPDAGADGVVVGSLTRHFPS
nr:hypothetical protein [Demequina litorisediminis]